MKNKKRFLKLAAVVFAVVFMALSLASCAMGGSAAAGDASGEHGSLKWEYKKDGQTLTISGNGEMTSFKGIEDIAWSSVATSVKKIVIEQGVTSVGDYAFFGMTMLEKVTFPADGFIKIGKLAFAYTPALKTIDLPDTVAKIGYGAFETSGLTEIALPASLGTIEANTFKYCTSLTTVVGAKVTTVKDNAFAYCDALDTVKLSADRNAISETAFAETAFKAEKIKDADGKVKVTYKLVNVDAEEDEDPVLGWRGAILEIGSKVEYHAPEIEGYEAVESTKTVRVGKLDMEVVISYNEKGDAADKTPEDSGEAESGETDSGAVQEPTDDKLEPMTIVALVVTVLIIIGIIVGTVLFIRHDKKNTGSRTVRKNKDDKKNSKKDNKKKK